MKTCTKCGETKELAEFHRDAKKHDGRRARCKTCLCEYKRQYYAANRDKASAYYYSTERDRRRHNKYNLTPEEIMQLQIRQCNSCGVCQTWLGDSPYVDHCHETGRVRGLLCSNCNLAIGKLGDTIEGVRRALHYLRFGAPV